MRCGWAQRRREGRLVGQQRECGVEIVKSGGMLIAAPDAFMVSSIQLYVVKCECRRFCVGRMNADIHQRAVYTMSALPRI